MRPKRRMSCETKTSLKLCFVPIHAISVATRSSKSRRKVNGPISTSISTSRTTRTVGYGVQTSTRRRVPTPKGTSGAPSSGFPMPQSILVRRRGQQAVCQFCRTHRVERRLTVWQPKHCSIFHVPEVFRTLRMAGS